MNRILVILNPFSGTKRANKYLADILSLFSMAGYETLVRVTTKRGDAKEAVIKAKDEIDRVVAIGGDGTFNEVVSGVIECGKSLPIGYIPAGSTNDFASALGLSKNIMTAAKDIVEGVPAPIDIGSFNGRTFTYTASFGAFTKASYSAPQNIKNTLGHFAYILEGIKDVADIKPIHIKIASGEKTEENDYIFGAVCNTTSMGGILTISPKIVDMSDGKLEFLLIKMPVNTIELQEIIRAITTYSYDSTMLTFLSANRATITCPKNMNWTLDGEFEQGAPTVEIKNLHNAIKVITKRKVIK